MDVCFPSLSAGGILVRSCVVSYWHRVVAIADGIVSALASSLLVVLVFFDAASRT